MKVNVFSVYDQNYQMVSTLALSKLELLKLLKVLLLSLHKHLVL